MVNIPLLTMDDYGILEPTDIGTMTIDYDSKDDFRRRNRWDHEEVTCMLNLIKENNFIRKYSVLKMSAILSQMLQKRGWNRTERQIHLKLTTMRKNYLTCEKQKLINANTKDCPFYKELREIYRDANHSNGIDYDDYDTSSQEECLIKFPGDSMDWTKGEVQKMLNLIKTMKLKNELTLTFFSPAAVKMVAEALLNSGFDRSSEQVKNALINLRTMYIDFKISFDNNECPSECMFYPCLDFLWGKEYKKCRLKERQKKKLDDIWSTEETIVLLTLIKDLNLTNDAYKNTVRAAEKLMQNLDEHGYNRTVHQIMNRLDYLNSEFMNAHESYSEGEAVQRFPFYTLYKKLFERQFKQNIINQNNTSKNNSIEYTNFCDNILKTSEPVEKEAVWTKDEVKLLLKTVQNLTSKSHSNESLEDEKLQKIVAALAEADYHKTAEQIKRKLSLLKTSYMKCNLQDSSEKDIFECPFYNELHSIFHTPVSDERYEFIQNFLMENADLNTSKSPDHSYTNVKLNNSSSNGTVNDKVTVVPNKCLDTWFPVESIVEVDSMNNSSTLDFNNLPNLSGLSNISNKEEVKAIEDAILASLPDNSDLKLEENCALDENTISQTNQVMVAEERVPPIINDVAFDEEITTTTITSEEIEPKLNKIYKYPDDLNSNSPVNGASRRRTPLSFDDEGQPPNKKPRIIEDEKIIGKNKFLLRPVDDVNPSALNITNNKFVRLIVANEPNKNRVNHITAHIEPLNINTTNSVNSVSSGMSSPVERTDILKLATEKILTKEDYDLHKLETEALQNQYNTSNGYISNPSSGIEAKISESIKEAVQTMIKHDELLQEKHHAWMEKQFELQRKHDEDQKKALVDELKELRSIVSVLLGNSQLPVNTQDQ